VGKMSQSKGRAFELKVLKSLWTAVGRAWPWKAHERPDEGATVPEEFMHIHLEMKAQERLDWWGAVQQARDGAKLGRKREWAVIAKKNRKGTVVVMDYDTWVQLQTTCFDSERGRLA